MGAPSPTEVRSRLLAWYAANRRDLPWRRTRDPYRILVAEYLLQRTRIASGTPYYERFLMRFPTVQDLAAASLDDVLAVWEGLGFYGRARRLHAAARVIVAEHAGKVPPSYEVLAALPGIGPYTAGAIASIAFGIVAPAVDGNVLRVLARLFRIHEDVTRGCPPPVDRARRHPSLERRPRRIQPGDHGTRRDDMHADPSGLRPMSSRESMPRAGRR